MEYACVGSDNYHSMNSTMLQMRYASNKVLVQREILVYTFESFLAEFGGALSLFLGFSFFMAWTYAKSFFGLIWTSALKYGGISAENQI